MKLSQETLKILKNFSGINSNLLLKENSNLLETVSPQKTSLASVTIAETFPVEFGIYDLGQFLGVLDSIGEDSELEFSKDSKAIVAYISNGRAKAKYFSASPAVLITADKQINFSPDRHLEFTINGKELDSLLKLAAILQVPNLTIERTTEAGLVLTVCDPKNPTKDNYSIEIPEDREQGEKSDFKVSLKVENIKMIPGEYSVDVHPAGIVRFTSKGIRDLTYYVAAES